MRAKAVLRTVLIFLLSFSSVACATGEESNDEAMKRTMNITVDGVTLVASMEDNSSADALLEHLEEGPVTVEMEDYASMEKVGSLGFSLPRNDRPTDTSAGDIILYQGYNFVIYYDTNSWNFTKLGRIEGVSPSELRTVLGEGNVSVTLSIGDGQ